MTIVVGSSPGRGIAQPRQNDMMATRIDQINSRDILFIEMGLSPLNSALES